MSTKDTQARLEALNDSRKALALAFSTEHLNGIDKALTAEVKAGVKVRNLFWRIVQQTQDLGVPAGDTGVTKLIQVVLKEHADSAFGPVRPESGEARPERRMYEDWSKVVQRAVFHAVPEAKFSISLKNNPDFKIGEGKAGPAKAGNVSTTTLFELAKTASKLLAQARMLNQLEFSGELLDVILKHYPEFKELGDDGKPVAK